MAWKVLLSPQTDQDVPLVALAAPHLPPSEGGEQPKGLHWVLWIFAHLCVPNAQE